MKGFNRKTFFYILCACQIVAVLVIIFTYYRNVEGNGQEYRFKCDSKNPFHWYKKGFAKLNLDIERVPYDRYVGRKVLARGMIVYCKIRDIHGYHQIESVSLKPFSAGVPFMKTRVEAVSDETIRLEIKFSRYPLQGDRITEARNSIVNSEMVVILGARISKRGTVYAKNLYVGDMLIEDYVTRYNW